MTEPNTLPPAVSVILVTFNGWEFTHRCLERLFSEPFDGGLEVVIVDNASSDGTPDKLRSTFPQVRLVESGYNAGFGTACNLGFDVARGEFCVLLNNDALLESGQLAALLDSYRELGLSGIYTARVVDENGCEEASCFRDISANDLLRDTVLLMSTALKRHTYALSSVDDEALAIEACSGAFWLCPRGLWEKVGGFDEQFFMYYEDIDLCRRARSLGYGCYVNTRISIRHDCGGSSTGNINRLRTVDRSQRLFYRKHYGRTGAFKARLYQVLRSAPRTLVHGLLGFDEHHRRASAMHAALLYEAIFQP